MSRPPAQPIACDHAIPFRDRCPACEEHYDADRKRLAAIEQRELERKEGLRAVSAEWTCDRCGERAHFYEPGPRFPCHAGPTPSESERRRRIEQALPARCGGTWRRS